VAGPARPPDEERRLWIGVRRLLATLRRRVVVRPREIVALEERAADADVGRRGGTMRHGILRTGLVLALSLPTAAWAIDTVEAFGAGNYDVELYIGGEGLGRRGEAAMVSTFQLGYGLSDRVSAYVNGSATPDVIDDTTVGSLRAGAYASLLDSEHFDLDVFVDYGSSDGTSGFAAGAEVNLEVGRFGLFAVAWEDLAALGEPDLMTGALCNVADGHQLLVGLDPFAAAVAAGYNVVLHEGVELVNEVACELPRDGAGAALSIVTGVILTL
jgi:hypothetical protein